MVDRFAEPQTIHRIENEKLSELKSIKKSIIRAKGQFVAVQKLEGRSVIYSTFVPRCVPSKVFDSIRFENHFEFLIESFFNDIAEIDFDAPKPITTSRGWKLPDEEKKGWSRTMSKVSPNVARTYAAELKAKTFDIEVEATRAVQDGVVVTFPSDDQGKSRERRYRAMLSICD